MLFSHRHAAMSLQPLSLLHKNGANDIRYLLHRGFSTKKTISSINQEEVDKFSDISNDWWNPIGPFRMLHQMNPTRMEFILSTSSELSPSPGKYPNNTLSKPLKSYSALDIGCGGGMLSESLVRSGAREVIGIDASSENIEIARRHSRIVLEDDQIQCIKYLNCAAEDLVQSLSDQDSDIDSPKKFDIVCAMEIIEHVENPKNFIQTCSSLINPGGILYLSSMNKTYRSYFETIVLAENILNWVPQGTHDWKKYIEVDKLKKWLASSNLELNNIKGIGYNPLNESWYLRNDLSVNYILAAKKSE